MKARVFITLNCVLDPQGHCASATAPPGLGFPGVGGVRQGKVIDLELSENGCRQGESLAQGDVRKVPPTP